MRDMAHGKSHSARMCEECFATLNTLNDIELPCSKPGCDGTWIWNRYQQLEAMHSKNPEAKPRGFCQKCLDEMKNVKPRQIPCRLKGCSNTWTLTAREQLELGDKPVPHKLCDECFEILKGLEDRELKCRVNGCSHTFVWNRFQQLEHIRAGKSLDNPPQRMCESCFEKFRGLKPMDVKCRIRGCENTWVFSPYEQLEQILKNENNGENGEDKGTAPEPPGRMCKDCFNFFNGAVEQQIPCKNKNCGNTWTFTKSMQLSFHINGHGKHPMRYCDECQKKLEAMADREMPCMMQGCDGTWTYGKEEQLRDETGGHQPQKKRCRRCSDFLAEHPTIEVPCEKCGKPIQVKNLQQLECELGTSTMPTLCADCVREKLLLEVPADNSSSVIHRPKIVIPKTGPWSEIPAISAFPKRLTPAKKDMMSEAALRVVCIGDSIVYSCGNEQKSWPLRLENVLNERLDGQVAVLNAGIGNCTTEMGIARFDRDVTPFKPQAVVYSFVLADVMAASQDDMANGLSEYLAKCIEKVIEFGNRVKAIGATPCFLIPNPVAFAENSEEDAELSSRREQLFARYVSALRKELEQAGIQVADAVAMFGIAGEQVAKKWMSGWFMHNDEGAANIANWVKDEIVGAGVLEKAGKI